MHAVVHLGLVDAGARLEHHRHLVVHLRGLLDEESGTTRVPEGSVAILDHIHCTQ